MNLDFTSEQDMLRDSAAKFLANEFNYERLREIEDSETGYCPELWGKMAELGWLGLPFPEEAGGFDGTFMDLAIIQEEIGKALLPSPYFSTVVQCGNLILEAASAEQQTALIGEIAGGALIMAYAQYEEEASFRETGINMAATVAGDGYTLTGKKFFVMDANIANKMIVAARPDGQGVTLFLVDAAVSGISVEKLPTVGKDNTCVVTFDGVQAEVLGAVGEGWKAIEVMNAKAAVAKAAEMVGGCRVALQMCVDYSKERVQYGKPIGGNQALQHYMSNMLLACDTAGNFMLKVVSLIDDGDDFTKEASVLKAAANENYKFVAERAVQIHGGIGTTREHNIGLYYRRAKAWETTCGDSEFHHDIIIDALAGA